MRIGIAQVTRATGPLDRRSTSLSSVQQDATGFGPSGQYAHVANQRMTRGRHQTGEACKKRHRIHQQMCPAPPWVLDLVSHPPVAREAEFQGSPFHASAPGGARAGSSDHGEARTVSLRGGSEPPDINPRVVPTGSGPPQNENRVDRTGSGPPQNEVSVDFWGPDHPGGTKLARPLRPTPAGLSSRPHPSHRPSPPSQKQPPHAEAAPPPP